MQRNQASDAISKNSRMAAGALQARSISSGSDFKSAAECEVKIVFLDQRSDLPYHK
jgi:hypothetical protein